MLPALQSSQDNINSMCQCSAPNLFNGSAGYPLRLQGNRDNIDSMAGGSQKVLTQVLLLLCVGPGLPVCRQHGPTVCC